MDTVMETAMASNAF